MTTLMIHGEIEELEPGPPDAHGVRWARRRMTGRGQWECGCGQGCSWAPLETSNAEAIEHIKAHQEGT